jgi:hypothetical protein
MKIQFDFGKVRTVEFGVCLDVENDVDCRVIAVDRDVQDALVEMAVSARDDMLAISESPTLYSPSERHPSKDYLYLPLRDEMAARMRELHEASNLPSDAGALKEPEGVFCYFARLIDSKGKRLTALRRATQFKGVLKSRLIRLVTDALKMVEDKVFKLDTDFDMLVDAENVHILRPASFEFAGKLQEAVLAAVPENIRQIQNQLSFVDFTPIEEYASGRPRAARYLASIRAQGETRNIDEKALRQQCRRTGVQVGKTHGKLVVAEGQVMAFLEVLDRRRYEVELVAGKPERYRAASRQRLAKD